MNNRKPIIRALFTLHRETYVGASVLLVVGFVFLATRLMQETMYHYLKILKKYLPDILFVGGVALITYFLLHPGIVFDLGTQFPDLPRPPKIPSRHSGLQVEAEDVVFVGVVITALSLTVLIRRLKDKI